MGILACLPSVSFAPVFLAFHRVLSSGPRTRYGRLCWSLAAWFVLGWASVGPNLSFIPALPICGLRLGLRDIGKPEESPFQSRIAIALSLFRFFFYLLWGLVSMYQCGWLICVVNFAFQKGGLVILVNFFVGIMNASLSMQQG